MSTPNSAPRIEQLLPKHELTHQTCPLGEILDLRTTHAHGGIYNGTAPIKIGEKTIIAARVDYPGSEEADTEFLRRNGGPLSYDYDPSLPTLRGLQDPSIAVVGEDYYIGGIRVYKDPATDRISGWDPAMWRIKNLDELDGSKPPTFVGPMHSKGLHPLSKDGELAGFFIRPSDGEYPLGKNRYLPLENGQKPTADDLAAAPVIEPFIADEFGEWGGVSQAIYLGDHFILATMHLARRAGDGVSREYYGGLTLMREILFNRRVKRLEVVTQMLVSCRGCFPNVDSDGNAIQPKSPDLQNVHYLKEVSLEEKMGYGGVSDSVHGRLAIGGALAEIQNHIL